MKVVPAEDQLLRLRTFDIEPRVIEEMAASLWHGRGTVEFRHALLADDSTVDRLADAHRSLDGGDLQSEIKLYAALEQLVARHATPTGAARALPSANARVARARELLDDRVAETVSLEALAEAAGLSRFHLIRSFRREYGVTPTEVHTSVMR